MPTDLTTLILGMVIMAGVTYLCRVLTLVLVRRKIENRFLRSVLTYMPFGVLAAMVFPEIFYSTSTVHRRHVRDGHRARPDTRAPRPRP